MMGCCLVRNLEFFQDVVINWGLHILKCKYHSAVLCTLSWEAVMLHVWIQQKVRIHAGNVKTKESVIQAINPI